MGTASKLDVLFFYLKKFYCGIKGGETKYSHFPALEEVNK